MEPLRDQSSHPPFYRDEHLFVDLRQPLVILDSETVMLTSLEYRLLALLVQHAGEVVHRATILTYVWGYKPEVHTRTLDVHIRRLRKKLGIHGGRCIETIVRIGYSFRPPGSEANAE